MRSGPAHSVRKTWEGTGRRWWGGGGGGMFNVHLTRGAELTRQPVPPAAHPEMWPKQAQLDTWMVTTWICDSAASLTPWLSPTDWYCCCCFPSPPLVPEHCPPPGSVRSGGGGVCVRGWVQRWAVAGWAWLDEEALPEKKVKWRSEG